MQRKIQGYGWVPDLPDRRDRLYAAPRKVLAKQGACPEALWPYDIAKFAKRPPAPAFREAERHQAMLYQHLTPTLTQLKGCLAAGYHFVFGFTVYESFESAAWGEKGYFYLPYAYATDAGLADDFCTVRVVET